LCSQNRHFYRTNLFFHICSQERPRAVLDLTNHTGGDSDDEIQFVSQARTARSHPPKRRRGKQGFTTRVGFPSTGTTHPISLSHTLLFFSFSLGSFAEDSPEIVITQNRIARRRPVPIQRRTSRDGTPVAVIVQSSSKKQSSTVVHSPSPSPPKRLDGFGECSICMDGVTAPSATPCGHVFCTSCIEGWLKSRTSAGTKPICPTCRKDVPVRYEKQQLLRTGGKGNQRHGHHHHHHHQTKKIVSFGITRLYL